MMIQPSEWQHCAAIVLKLMILCFVLTSCAAPKTKVRMLIPAKHNEATQYRNIAVLPFTGPNARSLAGELEAELVSIIVEQKSFFNVVERVRLKHALKELELGQSGLVNAKHAVRVGRFVGAEAIYTGQLHVANVNQQFYEETRQKCIKRKDPEKSYSKCLAYRDYEVDCTHKTATFQFAPKLIVVETSRVIYSKNIEKTSDAKHCEDENTPIMGDHALIDRAKHAAFLEFKLDIAPSYIDQEITMMDDDEGLSDNASKKFNAALAFAKENRMDRACDLWTATAQLGNPTVSLIHNLGLCAEIKSNFRQALEYYRRADGMLLKPDETVSDALVRIQQKIRQQSQLNEQL